MRGGISFVVAVLVFAELALCQELPNVQDVLGGAISNTLAGAGVGVVRDIADQVSDKTKLPVADIVKGVTGGGDITKVLGVSGSGSESSLDGILGGVAKVLGA